VNSESGTKTGIPEFSPTVINSRTMRGKPLAGATSALSAAGEAQIANICPELAGPLGCSGESSCPGTFFLTGKRNNG